MPRKKKKNNSRLITILLASGLITISFTLFVVAVLVTSEKKSTIDEFPQNIIIKDANYIIGEPGSTHHHSTFLVFLNGELLRFDKGQYWVKDPRIHLHPPFWAEFHSHATNVSIGLFFKTIGMNFNSTCFETQNQSFCNNETHKIHFYVNGNQSMEFQNRLTQNWDRYLIAYGNYSQSEIDSMLGQVPDIRASPPIEGKEPAARPIEQETNL